MITLNEFVHLYLLKDSKEFGYYELVPWDRRSWLIVDLPSSFRYWKSRYFFVLGNGWETFSNDFWGDVPRLMHRGRPLYLVRLPCIFFFFLFVFLLELSILTLCGFLCLHFTVKDHPELESRFVEHVHAAVECVSTIDDFDNLVDPRTLARHYFRTRTFPLRPSCYSLRRKSKLF